MTYRSEPLNPMATNQNTVESSTINTSRRSRRTVEPAKPSKEFHTEADHLTVEVVHAERVLREYFEKLGYEEWIYGCLCSRKLLEKVQQRMPNPPLVSQWLTQPDGLAGIQEGPEPRPFTVADLPEPLPQMVAQQHERILGVEEMAPFTTADMGRVEQHLYERRMRQEMNQIVEANTARNPDGTPYQGTAGGPANDPAHDTPF